uniref:C3H1-type domain-containing protein n=1 Tax=Schistocephalus solidus TaxID=70667 RepID=A0A0V0J8F4_SCHSO
MGQLLAEELEHRLHLGAGTDWFDDQHFNKACSSGVQRRIMCVSYPPACDSGYPSSVGSHSPNERISRRPTPEPMCTTCLLSNHRNIYQTPNTFKTAQPGNHHSTTIGQYSTVARRFSGPSAALQQPMSIKGGSDRRGRIIRGRPVEDVCSRYQTTDAFFSRATMTMANRLQAHNQPISPLTDLNISSGLNWDPRVDNQSHFEQPSPVRQASVPNYTLLSPTVGRPAYHTGDLDPSDLWSCGFEGQFQYQPSDIPRAVTKQDLAVQWAISKNIRYKTKTCLHWEKLGTCPAGKHCQFAHGACDLRQAKDHPKFRTQLCVHFASTGYCPYENNCFFRHLNMSYWPRDLPS